MTDQGSPIPSSSRLQAPASANQHGVQSGPMSGRNVIGETTEALHKFLFDGMRDWAAPARLEEDLKFVPKDREEVIYIYLYRAAQNTALINQKRVRQAPVLLRDAQGQEEIYYHRPPIMVDVFYLVAVHSKFRSDAERMLGWLMLRLNEATHLIYRPRRFLLPDGRAVDSLGRAYDASKFQESLTAGMPFMPEGFLPPGMKSGGSGASEDSEGDGEMDPSSDPNNLDNLHMEKVSLALVEDLTVGDAINLFTLHEAPYRPFLTYRARMALDGPLYKPTSSGTTVRMDRLDRVDTRPERAAGFSANGRVRSAHPTPGSKQLPGPKPHQIQRIPRPGEDLETLEDASSGSDINLTQPGLARPDNNPYPNKK